MEAQRIAERFPQEEHKIFEDRSVDLKDFPNADFYFKLVAKVNGKYYSIYDGKTEYVIGQTLHQKVKSNHQGGYYVYGSLREAIFADIPYNKGGHFIAPRTVLKVIAWGSFIVYDKGKLAFSNIMPVQDLGLPIGYKNTKESVKIAQREWENRVHRSKEYQWDRNLVQSRIGKENKRRGYEDDKFENYFGHKAVQQLESQIQSKLKKSTRPVDHKISEQIQSGLEQMIADLENKYH